MPKTADRQYEIHPWKIIEKGFRPQQSRVSESIFSLSNEHMGVRGYFEEGYSGESLVGSYINGVYEKICLSTSHYKGISDRFAFMINTLDWPYTRISMDGEQLDLGTSQVTGFVRELDMRNGLLTRWFVWGTKAGKRAEVTFVRFLSMVDPHVGYQQVRLKPLNFTGCIAITSALDFSLIHHSQPGRHWDCLRKGQDDGTVYIMSRTKNSKICVFSGFQLDSDHITKPEYVENESLAGAKFELDLTEGQETSFDKKAANLWRPLDDDAELDAFLSSAIEASAESFGKSFADALREQTEYWSDVWEKSDIVIKGDNENQYDQGIEMLVEISRFLRDRCQKGQRSGRVGYYCVMGPDEFQMMVNHNCYTNSMAKKTFMFALEVLEQVKINRPGDYLRLLGSAALSEHEMAEWASLARDMYIPYDEETGIYEQHDGFFDLPHIDIDSIPETEFPLYNHWSYDRIFGNDMIKQPDVLMFMFLHSQEFSRECKRANYEYYEPRCIHESSLSPSIHSIFAAELGKAREAYDFFRFATRLDLDNYNRNTDEGLHLTSIAAAWMNIVYGFGGMRSNGAILSFRPSIPASWEQYTFKIVYRDSVLEIRVGKAHTTYRVLIGDPLTIKVNDRVYKVSDKAIQVSNTPNS